MWVQTLDEAVYVSFQFYALRKSFDPSVLLPYMGKIGRLLGQQVWEKENSEFKPVVFHTP